MADILHEDELHGLLMNFQEGMHVEPYEKKTLAQRLLQQEMVFIPLEDFHLEIGHEILDMPVIRQHLPNQRRVRVDGEIPGKAVTVPLGDEGGVYRLFFEGVGVRVRGQEEGQDRAPHERPGDGMECRHFWSLPKSP